MASTVFSNGTEIVLHKVEITVVNTPLPIDSNNALGIAGKHCILTSILYYKDAVHSLSLYNGSTEIQLPFDVSAGIQSPLGYIVFSDLGQPLQLACSTAVTVLCGISYNPKFIGS